MKKGFLLVGVVFFCCVLAAQDFHFATSFPEKKSLSTVERTQLLKNLAVCYPLEIEKTPTRYSQDILKKDDFFEAVFSVYDGTIICRTARKTVEVNLNTLKAHTHSHVALGVNNLRKQILWRASAQAVYAVTDLISHNEYEVESVQEEDEGDKTVYIVSGDKIHEKFSHTRTPICTKSISIDSFTINVPNRTQDAAQPVIIRNNSRDIVHIVLPFASRLSSTIVPLNYAGRSLPNQVYADISPTGLFTLVDPYNREIVQALLPLPENLSDEQLRDAHEALSESKEKAQQIILAAFKLAGPQK